MKRKKIYEASAPVAIDDVMISDPNIAAQIVQTQKEINSRLKRIAQLQSEIATYNQQAAALKDKAVKAQQASLSSAKEKPQTPEGLQVVQQSPPNESLMQSLQDFLNEEEDEVVRDPDVKDEDFFFVKIPAQEEEEGDIIAKVFREEPDSEWYIRDVEGEAEWLDDLVFEDSYDKPEIIDYLGSIFGEVIEIDQDEFEYIIDDKEDLDYDYYQSKEDEYSRDEERNRRINLS
jgi:hypothetical protein